MDMGEAVVSVVQGKNSIFNLKKNIFNVFFTDISDDKRYWRQIKTPIYYAWKVLVFFGSFLGIQINDSLLKNLKLFSHR